MLKWFKMKYSQAIKYRILVFDYFVFLVDILVRFCRWVQFRVFTQFSKFVESRVLREGEKLGVVVHFTQNLDVFDQVWIQDDERHLKKCKYSSIVHVNVCDKSLFVNVGVHGGVALFEGFVKGEWADCNGERDIVELIVRIEESGVDCRGFGFFRCLRLLENWVIEKEEDGGGYVGDDVLRVSFGGGAGVCGLWEGGVKLSNAVNCMMELVGVKLGLRKGMKVLGVGGIGFGGIWRFLAERFGVQVIAYVGSVEELEVAKSVCEGVSVEVRVGGNVERVMGWFDRVAWFFDVKFFGGVEVRRAFEVIDRVLKPDGLAIVQVLGSNHGGMPSSHVWVQKYLFPTSKLPSVVDICSLVEGNFVIEDWQNFGQDCEKTIRAWRKNFVDDWWKLEGNYSDAFYSAWMYYLCALEGCVVSKRVQLWHIVLSKGGVEGVGRKIGRLVN